MIQRNYYLDRLIRNMWNGEIKVITGIRRCGKSVLLFELFDEYLRNHGTDATQIIKIELDQRRYYKYRNPITLCEYVEQLVLGQQDKKLYLFIDEVQLTAKVIDQENGGIEVTIYDMLNELKAYKNLDVYVTGSNSKGLSKDIATEFRGRATQIMYSRFALKSFTPLSVVMNARHWTLICCTAVCRACLPYRMIRIKRIICPLSTRNCM